MYLVSYIWLYYSLCSFYIRDMLGIKPRPIAEASSMPAVLSPSRPQAVFLNKSSLLLARWYFSFLFCHYRRYCYLFYHCLHTSLSAFFPRRFFNVISLLSKQSNCFHTSYLKIKKANLFNLILIILRNFVNLVLNYLRFRIQNA